LVRRDDRVNDQRATLSLRTDGRIPARMSCFTVHGGIALKIRVAEARVRALPAKE